MKDYLVETVTTGFFSGTLKAAKLNTALNKRAAEGWRLARTIHERKRVLVLFSRESHFLIFERDVYDQPEVLLLRQLLVAYGHEPTA
jgi:hypothetical protein